MTRIFTDETGQAWEEVPPRLNSEYITNGKLIRPVVKAEPKWQVDLNSAPLNSEGHRWFIRAFLPNITDNQAQLIKQAVEALMEYIEVNQTDSTYLPDSLISAIKKAHAALREEKS